MALQDMIGRAPVPASGPPPPVQGGAPRPEGGGGEPGPVERPLITASGDEDKVQQANIVTENIEDYFYGEESEPNFARAVEQISAADDLPTTIGTLAEDLMREIHRNAMLAGHLIDPEVAADGLKTAIEVYYDIADGVGAYGAKDETQEQTDMATSLLAAGHGLFIQDPPDGLQVTEEQAQQFMAMVESGAFDTPPPAQRAAPQQVSTNGRNPGANSSGRDRRRG